MKKNIVILTILLSTVYLLSFTRVSAYKDSVSVSLVADHKKELMYYAEEPSGLTLALYTESQDYPVLFSFSTSGKSTPTYNTIVGATMNFNSLSPVQYDILLLYLQNESLQILPNRYKGVLFY